MKRKQVPLEVLRAFGYKKCKGGGKGQAYPKNTYYNKELDSYYSPDLMTIIGFADNLVNHVTDKVVKTIADESYNFVPRIR